jgi:RNA polymerase sigma factor (sigma-70 family)
MPDDRAFEELWAAEFASVTWTAYLIVGRWDDATDIAAEAFTRTYQHWRRVARYERPSAWVHRAATNLAISATRRARPPLPAEDRIVPPPEIADPVLTEALGRLTPAQRAVIALRFYLDWSVEDVAKALRKRPGTVTALTHQGMERLRHELLAEDPRDE